MTARYFAGFIVAMLLVASQAFAQTDADELAERERREAEMQAAFVTQMNEIVADLNEGSFRELSFAIDRDDFIERIFNLRLIDPKVRRDFRDEMKKEPKRFEDFVGSLFSVETKDGYSAKLLLVESRGDRGRAVVRFDLPYFQVNYQDYDLRLRGNDKLVVVDWTDYLWGYDATDRVALQLISAQPNQNAVRKLIDFSNVREAEVFQVMEALKSARDRNFDRFFEIYDSMDARLQRQRALIMVGLDASRLARKRRNQRKMLEVLSEHYGDEPQYAISLLDYYFPSRQYQRAHDVLTNMQRTLRIDDGVTAARLSSAKLVMGDVEGAVEFAASAVEKEPEMELAWWAALRAAVTAELYGDSVAVLEVLTKKFGHELGPDALAKDPSMKGLLASQEYRAWLEAAESTGS